MFNGTFELQRYNAVENRIKAFDRYEGIGLDASGQYEMYKILLGDINKPPILVTAGVHGQESQTTQYSLYFFESIRDDTFPDKTFRDNLLENYLIVYLPCLNPWGMDNIPESSYYNKSATTYYRNSNYVDLNRDFVSISQQETKNVVDVMDDYDYFAHLDCHMMFPGYSMVDNEYFVVANENYDAQLYQNLMANRWETHTGTDVMRWSVQTERQQMVRGYSIDKSNPYTPYTLPFMTEIMRPTNDAVLLSNEEIYNYGFASLYEFFNTAEMFLNDSDDGNGGTDMSEIKKIVTPDGEVTFTRNSSGYIDRVNEVKKGENIRTTFERDSAGNITEYVTKRV